MFCPFCGSEILDDARFCSKCGNAMPPLGSADDDPTPAYGIPAWADEDIPAMADDIPAVDDVPGAGDAPGMDGGLDSTIPFAPVQVPEPVKPGKPIGRIIAIVIACLAVAGLIIGGIYLRNHGSGTAAPAADSSTAHAVVFTVDAPGYDSSTCSAIPLHVSGTQADGTAVSENAYIGADGRGLALENGSYIVTVIVSPLLADGTFYSTPSGTWTIELSDELAAGADYAVPTDEAIMFTVMDPTAITDSQIDAAYDCAIGSGMDTAAVDDLKAAVVASRQTALDAQTAEKGEQTKAEFESQDPHHLPGYMTADPTWISGYLSDNGYSLGSDGRTWAAPDISEPRSSDETFRQDLMFISGPSDSHSDDVFSYYGKGDLEAGTEPVGVQFQWSGFPTHDNSQTVKDILSETNGYVIDYCGLSGEVSRCDYTTDPDLAKSKYNNITEFAYRVGVMDIGGTDYAWIEHASGITSDCSVSLSLMTIDCFESAYGISPSDPGAAYSLAANA